MEEQMKTHMKKLESENDNLRKELQEVREKLTEFESVCNDYTNIEDLKKEYEKKIDMEKLKVTQAVNKLVELTHRKDFKPVDTKKITSSALKKKQNEIKKMQQELNIEKNKFGQMATKYMRENADLQALYDDENQQRSELQRDLDGRDSELEKLQNQNRALQNMLSITEPASITSLGESDGEGALRLEGWLDIPGKNLKRHGWKRHFVEVSSKKILFYESEDDKNNKKPYLVLDIDKLFHVRPVTQGDVIRAEAKDIPCIFQLLYAGEGENKRPAGELLALETQSLDDKSNIIQYKRHEFVTIHFHMPTMCEYCNKTLSQVIKPPPALECQLCHLKVHKDHYDKLEEFTVPCTVNIDANTAKNMILRAASADEQQRWINELHKQILRQPRNTVVRSTSTNSPR